MRNKEKEQEKGRGGKPSLDFFSIKSTQKVSQKGGLQPLYGFKIPITSNLDP